MFKRTATNYILSRVAGAVVFTFAMAAQAQTSPPPYGFFTGTTCCTGVWSQLTFPDGTFFGNFWSNSDNGWYITHEDLGSEFVMGANDGLNGVYMYDFGSSSWFYTTPGVFPFIYDLNSVINAWLWYLPDPTHQQAYTWNPREFHDMNTGQTIQLGAGGAGTTIPPDTPAANSVSITGGGNNGTSSGTAAPNTPLTFTFAYHDTPNEKPGDRRNVSIRFIISQI